MGSHCLSGYPVVSAGILIEISWWWPLLGIGNLSYVSPVQGYKISHFYRKKVSGESIENSAENKGSQEIALFFRLTKALSKNSFSAILLPETIPLSGILASQPIKSHL